MQLTAFYIVILFLILLVDISERRILNALALPGTLLAILAGLADGRDTFLAAFFGAALGFLFFYALYLIGGRFYSSTALGFGDVKLAMLLGAIMGIQQVLIVLSLGMLLAGSASIILLLDKRGNRQSTIPYGAFLAIAGIISLIWTNIVPS